MIAVPSDVETPASGRAKLFEIKILASSSLFGRFCEDRFSRTRASHGFCADFAKKNFTSGYLSEAASSVEHDLREGFRNIFFARFPLLASVPVPNSSFVLDGHAVKNSY